jgi:hypothetical protein
VRDTVRDAEATGRRK